MLISSLRSLCLSLGGDLVELSSERFDRKHSRTFYECPFARGQLGIDFSRKQVFYAGRPVWQEIIHEMGHVFASLKTPPVADEWNFLGWEYAVCLRLRGDFAAWKDNMVAYQVGKPYEGDEFGSLSDAVQNALLLERLAYAKKHKLVSDAGVPLTVRSSRR